jgi:hypothetical protein
LSRCLHTRAKSDQRCARISIQVSGEWNGMSDDLKQIIDSHWEAFRVRVETYAKSILEGGTHHLSSPYDVLRIQEIAMGWAIVIILAGTLWGMEGPFKRIDQYWTYDEQAEAIERWLLDMRCGIGSRLGDKLQDVRSISGVCLQPYEETRAFKKVVSIIGEILSNNTILDDTIRED